MRIVIDLDGVISELRVNNQTYDNVDVVVGARRKLEKLRANGHYVIIQTARNMKTQGGNVGKVVQNVGLDTLEWLDRNCIPYDEIYFGKPWGDVYIDDNAYRFKNWDDINDDGSNLPISCEKSKINILKKNTPKSITLVIPMAGAGDRFQSVGYPKPKPLIDVNGKPMFQRSVDCLPLDVFESIIFVCMEQHDKEYGIANTIQDIYEKYNVKIKYVDGITAGQAETVYIGLDGEPSDNGVMIHNCDSVFDAVFKDDLMKFITHYSNTNFIDYVCDSNTDGSYCYLDVKNDELFDIYEKEGNTGCISTGIYYFETISRFRYTYTSTFSMSNYDEQYISYMYKTMLDKGIPIKTRCTSSKFHDLGTPYKLYKYLEFGEKQWN